MCFVASLILSGVGCASAAAWRTLDRVPDAAVVLPVEGRLQVGNRCGPNALSILFAAAGKPVAEPEIARAVQNERLDGALNIDLLLYARAQGFPARFETGTIARLMSRIDDGMPTLLMMKLESRSRWSLRKIRIWHFLVVYGYSRSERVFLAHSGWGPRRITFSEIDKPWREAGYWMMDLGAPVAVTP